MQNRMKNHPLSKEQTTNLLLKTSIGNLGTIDDTGYPYVVPVHFIYLENKIYIHGLPKGKKINNILVNEKVCFEIYEMKSLILDELPCDTNTEYESVIIMGKATIVDDIFLKENVLNKIVEKYTPNFTGKKLPNNMINGTGVIEIEIKECTGKYYK